MRERHVFGAAEEAGQAGTCHAFKRRQAAVIECKRVFIESLKDENGGTVGIKLPCSVNVDDIYPYAKWFDTRVDNGVRFNCFLLFKRTHTLDSAEMSRLIRGTVAEAKELGVQTETPEELNRILGAWTPSKEE